MRRPTRLPYRGRLIRLGEMSKARALSRCAGVLATACAQGKRTQHGKPQGVGSDAQPDAREGQAGRPGVAERFGVPLKPGNAGEGKGPQFKTNAIRGEGPGDWGNLSTPKSVQKLQKAITRKRRQKPGYRFYALYDKISREDILVHAYAQCRSNKGAPGVDGQEFADIEAYGVQRWLGELALALRQDTYPTGSHQKSVHTESQRQTQAAGHLDLAGSGLHDSSDAGVGTDLRSRPSTRAVCLPPRRPAQQAVVEVGGLLHRGHPEVVDADLAHDFGSIPHAE